MCDFLVFQQIQECLIGFRWCLTISSSCEFTQLLRWNFFPGGGGLSLNRGGCFLEEELEEIAAVGGSALEDQVCQT